MKFIPERMVYVAGTSKYVGDVMYNNDDKRNFKFEGEQVYINCVFGIHNAEECRELLKESHNNQDFDFKYFFDLVKIYKI